MFLEADDDLVDVVLHGEKTASQEAIGQRLASREGRWSWPAFEHLCLRAIDEGLHPSMDMAGGLWHCSVCSRWDFNGYEIESHMNSKLHKLNKARLQQCATDKGNAEDTHYYHYTMRNNNIQKKGDKGKGNGNAATNDMDYYINNRHQTKGDKGKGRGNGDAEHNTDDYFIVDNIHLSESDLQAQKMANRHRCRRGKPPLTQGQSLLRGQNCAAPLPPGQSYVSLRRQNCAAPLPPGQSYVSLRGQNCAAPLPPGQSYAAEDLSQHVYSFSECKFW